MSRVKLSVTVPKGLDPAEAERYAQAAVDELARAYSATKPNPRPRGGLRTSFDSGADPVVLVFPRADLAPAFDQLLARGSWADPEIAYLVAALGAAIYGLTDPAAVLALTASHGVALRALALWNRQPDRPFDLGLRISTTALQLSFDPRKAPRPSETDELLGVKEGGDPPIAQSVVVSAQTLGTRALAAVSQHGQEAWIPVAAETYAILRRKYAVNAKCSVCGKPTLEPGECRDCERALDEQQ